jgi:hypothetical protein
VTDLSVHVRSISHSLDSRALAVGGWIVFVLATQRWYSWNRAVELDLGGDMPAYESIARAAPGLPTEPIRVQHAQRFPLHWLVGSIADVTGIGLHVVYALAMALCLSAILLAVHATLDRLDLTPGAYALCIGSLIAGAYSFRYLLIVPAMVGDALFVLGLSLVLLAFVSDTFVLLLAGLLVAVVARQTGLPLVLPAAAWLATRPGRRGRRIALAIALPVCAYAVIAVAAHSFARDDFGGFSRFTVLGSIGHPRELAAHVGRLALGVLVPLAFAVAAWLRTRRRLDATAWAVAGAAIVVLAQPLLLGPAWVVQNEARLAALATPALAVFAAWSLRAVSLPRRETIAIGAAIAAGSLHHLYSRAGFEGRRGWVALEVVAAVVIVVVLVGRNALAPDPAGAAGQTSP